MSREFSGTNVIDKFQRTTYSTTYLEISGPSGAERIEVDCDTGRMTMTSYNKAGSEMLVVDQLID
jgi:hypothetical protein